MTDLNILKEVNLIGLISPLVDSETNNFSERPNCHQNLEMIDFKQDNQVMITSTTPQPGPSSLHFTFMQGKEIHMSNLNTSHR